VKWNRINVGLITLILCYLFNVLFKWMPNLYSIIYFKGIFQVLRVVYDYTLGFLPFPSVYIIVPAFIGFFFYKRKRSKFWMLRSLIACLVWILVVFYIVWGFNYTQPSIYGQLKLNHVGVDSSYIDMVFEKQTLKLTKLLEFGVGEAEPQDIENILRHNQEELLREWGMPTMGRVRIRRMPGGSLLHFRTSGIYIPHVFEGHLDGGLYKKQHPFTMAHEMAHGYGFTDESVCNFIGYLTCLRSENNWIKYSAELAYWRYLARYYKRLHRETWSERYDKLDPMLVDDLTEISKHINQYKDWMPKYRDVIYDQYLKSHGVSAGIKSYDQMIHLIASYNEKTN